MTTPETKYHQPPTIHETMTYPCLDPERERVKAISIPPAAVRGRVLLWHIMQCVCGTWQQGVWGGGIKTHTKQACVCKIQTERHGGKVQQRLEGWVWGWCGLGQPEDTHTTLTLEIIFI